VIGLGDDEIQSDQPNFWTPGGYVHTYKEVQEYYQKSANKTSVYPAYVPPINIQEIPDILKNISVFGDNVKPSNDQCGMIYRKVQCSNNPEHHPMFRHMRCNDPGCPVCYVKFAARMADRVTERLQGFKTVWRDQKPYHLIFWSTKASSGRPYAGLREAFREARRLLELMGAESAVVWFHPFRIKKELKEYLRNYRRNNHLDGRAGFWKLAHDDVLNLGGLKAYIEYGPHWHAIATGYLKNFVDLDKKYGIGYKKRRYLDTEAKIYEVSHYISTHAAREWGKASVRYFGNLSYRILQRECVETKIKDVICPVCGASLEEYDCDEKGVCIQKLKDNITEKVKYYLYWKRGQPKPDMISHSQCMITRFCRD
jgi:hypothetical protein